MYKNTANKKIGLMLFALCFAAYTASYVGRLNFSAALAGMTSSGVLDKVQGGTIATLYYFCYAAGQLFSGWLGDRISPFVQVSIGVAGAALCNIGMAIVGDASAMTVIWGANGIFQSMLWAPTLVIISRIMPKDMCDKACVGMSLCSPLGILAAYIMSSLVLREGSYHGIFVGAGALLAVVFFSSAFSVGVIFCLDWSVRKAPRSKPRAEQIKVCCRCLLRLEYSLLLFR